MRSPMFGALAALAMLLAGCAAAPPPASGGPPAWAFTDTAGMEHTGEATRGEPVLLFFMATWCTSCRAMTPTLAALHQDYAPQGLRMFSVSFDRSDDAASLEAWKQQYNQSWPHGVDPGFEMQRTFEIVSQSSLVLLDRDGRVAGKWGYPGASEAELRAAVARTLAQEA